LAEDVKSSSSSLGCLCGQQQSADDVVNIAAEFPFLIFILQADAAAA